LSWLWSSCIFLSGSTSWISRARGFSRLWKLYFCLSWLSFRDLKGYGILVGLHEGRLGTRVLRQVGNRILSEEILGSAIIRVGELGYL